MAKKPMKPVKPVKPVEPEKPVEPVHPEHPDLGHVKQKLVDRGVEAVTCDLCNNVNWWVVNGFSEAERRLICGPKDLDCPGFGADAE